MTDLCHGRERNDVDPFIRPADPMADADGGVGRIVTQKNLLNLVNMAGTEV